MKKQYLVFILLVFILLHSIFGLCLGEICCDIEGMWEIFEGGNIGPDILVLNEDGTGIAYNIINSYQSWSIKENQELMNVEIKGELTWRITWQNDHSKNIIKVLKMELNGVSYNYHIYFDNCTSESQMFSLAKWDNALARCTYRKVLP